MRVLFITQVPHSAYENTDVKNSLSSESVEFEEVARNRIQYKTTLVFSKNSFGFEGLYCYNQVASIVEGYIEYMYICYRVGR